MSEPTNLYDPSLKQEVVTVPLESIVVINDRGTLVLLEKEVVAAKFKRITRVFQLHDTIHDVPVRAFELEDGTVIAYPSEGNAVTVEAQAQRFVEIEATPEKPEAVEPAPKD